MAHKWAGGLHNPCCMGGPKCCKVGQSQPWPTGGQIGDITPIVWAIRNACKQGENQIWSTSGQIDHITHAAWGGGGGQRLRGGNKLIGGPHTGALAREPHSIGGPQRFTTGDKFSSGPQVGRWAT